jgi:hypothetical protein
MGGKIPFKKTHTHTHKQGGTYIRKLRVVYIRGGFSTVAFS